MASCFENIQVPGCVWFEGGEKRNALASLIAGTLFFVGWWFIIDSSAKYPNELGKAYHICGVFSTVSLIMINSVTNAQMRGDSYDGGCIGARGAKTWLFLGFVMGFAAVIGACTSLFSGHSSDDKSHNWPNVSLLLQNLFILAASLIYKFGRSEEQWG